MKQSWILVLSAALSAPAAWAQAPDWAKVRVGVEGNYPPFSKLGTDGKLSGFDIDIALAVCADFTHASHAAGAADQGAGLYAAGVLISEKGYAADASILQSYARQHSMAVLMANHGGQTGGWQSAGRSGIWSEDGSLIVAAAGAGDFLVVAQRNDGAWQGRVVPVAHIQ